MKENEESNHHRISSINNHRNSNGTRSKNGCKGSSRPDFYHECKTSGRHQHLRAEQGLPALTLDSELNSYAAVRSEEINTVWSHTRPNGTSGADMISSTKWRGENLSYITYGSFGFSDSEQNNAADSVFASLKASPSHYSNMVSGNYTKIGIYTYVANTGSGVKLCTAYMFSN